MNLKIFPILSLLQDKKSLQLGPDDHLHLEGFASNVFAKADKQDRAGRADLYDKFFFLKFYYDYLGSINSQIEVRI